MNYLGRGLNLALSSVQSRCTGPCLAPRRPRGREGRMVEMVPTSWASGVRVLGGRGKWLSLRACNLPLVKANLDRVILTYQVDDAWESGCSDARGLGVKRIDHLMKP